MSKMVHTLEPTLKWVDIFLDNLDVLIEYPIANTELERIQC
jgi:hypothetical protein